MTINDPEIYSFMQELYSQSGGDTEKRVSLQDIAAALGQEAAALSAMSQDLIIEELVELKTLAGDIGITEKGLIALNVDSTDIDEESMPKLSAGPFLDENECMLVEKVTAKVRQAVSGTTVEYNQLEQLVIDLKTIEVQLLSPAPGTKVIQALLRQLAARLPELPDSQLATELSQLATE